MPMYDYSQILRPEVAQSTRGWEAFAKSLAQEMVYKPLARKELQKQLELEDYYKMLAERRELAKEAAKKILPEYEVIQEQEKPLTSEALANMIREFATRVYMPSEQAPITPSTLKLQKKETAKSGRYLGTNWVKVNELGAAVAAKKGFEVERDAAGNAYVPIQALTPERPLQPKRTAQEEAALKTMQQILPYFADPDLVTDTMLEQYNEAAKVLGYPTYTMEEVKGFFFGYPKRKKLIPTKKSTPQTSAPATAPVNTTNIPLSAW